MKVHHFPVLELVRLNAIVCYILKFKSERSYVNNMMLNNKRF